MTDDQKIVKFPNAPRPNPPTEDHLQTIKLAKVAVMPLMEYERNRKDVAKKFGWRPSFLDRMTKEIRGQLPPRHVWTDDQAPGNMLLFEDGLLTYVLCSFRWPEDRNLYRIVALVPGDHLDIRWGSIGPPPGETPPRSP